MIWSPSTIAPSSPGLRQDVDAHRPAAAQLAALWSDSRLLVAGGVLMLLALAPTWLLSLLLPQQFDGIDAYAKPLKFELSLGVYLLSLAWMRSFLTPLGRAGWTARLGTSVVPVVASFGEVAYILWRAAQGEGSHFNVASPAAALGYQLMGLGALALVGAAGLLAVLLQRHGVPGLHRARRASLLWALWLTLLLGGLAGIYVSSQPGHAVGAGGAAALPVVGWSRSAGDLRVAHFLGIHAMQLLPLAGWWFAQRLNAVKATQAVHATALLYVALTLATFVQARAGVPLLFGL